MINYTNRLDKAIRISAWAHEKQGQHRKGSDTPYVVHPFGVMIIASNVTDDEDVLIACLLHDILEDVDSDIYDESTMAEDFGDKVVGIVKDVTKDESEKIWRKRSDAYISHLEHEASDEAVIVCASDKTHNLLSILADFETRGNELWEVFTTKSSSDQLWWYESVLGVITKRGVDQSLIEGLSSLIEDLKSKLA